MRRFAPHQIAGDESSYVFTMLMLVSIIMAELASVTFLPSTCASPVNFHNGPLPILGNFNSSRQPGNKGGNSRHHRGEAHKLILLLINKKVTRHAAVCAALRQSKRLALQDDRKVCKIRLITAARNACCASYQPQYHNLID